MLLLSPPLPALPVSENTCILGSLLASSSAQRRACEFGTAQTSSKRTHLLKLLPPTDFLLFVPKNLCLHKTRQCWQMETQFRIGNPAAAKQHRSPKPRASYRFMPARGWKERSPPAGKVRRTRTHETRVSLLGHPSTRLPKQGNPPQAALQPHYTPRPPSTTNHLL